MQYTIKATSSGPKTIEQIKVDARKHPVVLSKALSRLMYFAREDSIVSAKAELDRPRKYTLDAIKYKKSRPTNLHAAIFINPKNEYIHRVVYGGVRTNRGRILVPAQWLRTDPHGNISKTRRRNILKHPKTFVVTKGPKQFILRRLRKKVEFIAVLKRRTLYQKQWWHFHASQLRTYERRFGGLFNQEFDRAMKKR